MILQKIKLEAKAYGAIIGGIVLLVVVGYFGYQYSAMKSQVIELLAAKVDAEKQLIVCQENSKDSTEALEKLKGEVAALQARNNDLVSAVALSGKRVATIKASYDTLLQANEKAPVECKAAMQWLLQKGRSK